MPTFLWQRYWYPEGAEITLDGRDFLPDPSQEWARFYNLGITTLQSISVPCAILLGEPGTGKSTAVQQYVDAANTLHPNSVLLLDLKGYSSDHSVDVAVFQHPRVAALANNPDARLTLVLDSLDELLFNEPGAGSFIARRVTQLPSERLTLRIVCRRAEWIPSLQTILAALYSPDGVQAYRLAPLTAANVITAADESGLPGQTFLEEVTERNLQPFARKPFTLTKFLITVFQQERGFPVSDAELYRRGCLLLAAETNPDRLEIGQIGTRTDVERLDIAERIAAMSVLGAKQHIATVADTEPGTDRLLMSEIIGRLQIRGDAPVDVASVREVLATALFSRLGPHDAAWDHRSIADYLAAAYVARHGVAPRIITSTILAGVESERRVPPQLVEFAAWLARLAVAFKEELLRKDPLVLLRSDISSLSTYDRKRLTSGIVDRLRGEVLEDKLAGARLNLLAHQELSEQIRPLLKKGNRVDVRRVAIQIAEENSLADLVPFLTSVGSDATETDHMRAYAIRAVSVIGSRDHKRAVRSILEHLGPDPDDEIKGATLICVWPDALSPQELFGYLSAPKNESLYGTYAAFLHRLESDPSLTGTDAAIIAGLDWIESNAALRLLDRFAEIGNEVVRHAWDRVEVEGVRTRLARIIATAVTEHSPVMCRSGFRSSEQEPSFGDLVSEDGIRRRRLLEALLPVACTRKIPPNFMMWGPNKVVQELDIEWLIDLATKSTDPELSHYILEVLGTAPRSVVVLDQVYQAVNKAVLGAPFDSWLFVPFGSDERKRQRTAYAQTLWYSHRYNIRDRRFKERRELSSVAAFVQRLDKGDSNSWMRLALRLTNEHTTPTRALTTAGVAEEERPRLAEAAKNYLDISTIELTKWLEGRQIPNGAVAAHVALELLWEIEPSYLVRAGEDFWGKWSLLVVWYPFGDHDNTVELTRLLFAAAPDAATAAVLTALSGDVHTAEAVVRRTSSQWPPSAEQPIIDRLEEGHYTQQWAAQAVRELITRNSERVIRAAVEAVQNGVADEPNLLLATELVRLRTCQAWPHAWRHISSKTAFGQGLLKRLVERSALSYIAELTVSDLQQFLVYLVREFPPNEDLTHVGAYTPEFRDEVPLLRSALIGTLETRGADGIAALRRSRRELKGAVWLDWSIARARTNALRVGWHPLNPDQLMRMVSDADPAWREIASKPYVSWFLSSLFTIAGSLFTSGQTPLQQFGVAVNIALVTLTLTVGFRRPIPWWFPLLVIVTPSVFLLTVGFWFRWL